MNLKFIIALLILVSVISTVSFYVPYKFIGVYSQLTFLLGFFCVHYLKKWPKI